jgi:uncharacterized protein
LQVTAASGETEGLAVEVVYATPQRQRLIRLAVAPGTTAAEAIDQCGIRAEFPQIEAQPQVGIFSCRVALDQVLRAGDRVEIYRPLLADPKAARRARAEQQKLGKPSTRR